MSVKIRLTRMGTHKRPFYRLVVTDSRAPRDGECIDSLGTYDPLKAADAVSLDAAKIVSWLTKGAQPTPTVKQILTKAGIYNQLSQASAQ